ncbi:MAG: 2-dehydro-3-deoxygalactonokinase [Azospirillaceae bacterium]
MPDGGPGGRSTALIGVDWGTTNLRAYRLAADGQILERAESAHGILALPPGGFAEALSALVEPWRRDAPAAPMLLSGMVGSQQGWREAPYVALPAGPAEIASALVPLPEAGDRAALVPGLIDRSGVPDVIRGEETQILGLPPDPDGDGSMPADGVVCLPGTHSKWARIESGQVTRFATFMTGELHALLGAHGILAKTLEAEEQEVDDAAFAAGLERAAQPGGLTHHLFGLRGSVLDGVLEAGHGAAYLSGLVIGHELLGARALLGPVERVTLVGARGPVARWRTALARCGVASDLAPPDIAAAGLYRLARMGGVLT